MNYTRENPTNPTANHFDSSVIFEGGMPLAVTNTTCIFRRRIKRCRKKVLWFRPQENSHAKEAAKWVDNIVGHIEDRSTKLDFNHRHLFLRLSISMTSIPGRDRGCAECRARCCRRSFCQHYQTFSFVTGALDKQVVQERAYLQVKSRTNQSAQFLHSGQHFKRVKIVKIHFNLQRTLLLWCDWQNISELRECHCKNCKISLTLKRY